MKRDITELLDELANIDPDEYIAQQRLFETDGVVFEVVAKVRAIRNDGKVVDTLVGPIVLKRDPSLYQAMQLLAISCSVEEFKIDAGELMLAAAEVNKELATGKHKWVKPRR